LKSIDGVSRTIITDLDDLTAHNPEKEGTIVKDLDSVFMLKNK